MGTQQGNALEDALQKAASEPAHRPAFFKLLMESTVYVLGDDGNAEQWIAGAQRIDEQQPVNLRHWKKQDGSSTIPFFTSVEALQRAVSDKQPFLAMPTRHLFAMTAGAELYLNPELPYGKEFGPDEVSALLLNDGDALTERVILEGDSRITLTDSADKPAQMVDSLTQLFAQYRQVRRAFMVLIREDGDAAPHWLIGLDCDGDEDAAIQAAGRVATDTAPDDQPVDLCLVSQDEPGISHYFDKHINPFYERRWGSWLRSLKTEGQA